MVGYLEHRINFFPEQLSCKHWFELLITIDRNVAETSLFFLGSCEDDILKTCHGAIHN